ncbi:MAG TPA: hypothetical protein VMS56_08140 [Thermoanaerobaculia bacterium]|nr:hypothetical protein [Thermoanaerobaculia bacterium]
MTPLIGRVLQVAAMIILPVALWIGLVHDQVRAEVALLALGGFLFLAGWLLARERES